MGIDRVTKAKIHKRNDMKKLGSSYGGWFVPTSLLDKTSICYCAGCGEDISFDLELIEKFDCTVFSFDPTPRAVKYVTEKTKHVDNYHFQDIGLWDQDTTLKFYVPKNPEHVSLSAVNLQNTQDFTELKVRRLNGIMKDNGHKSINLLKIDIEGAEYKVINSIVEDKLDVNILLVEFDELCHRIDNNYVCRIRNTVNLLNKSKYILIHVDGANYTFLKHQ
jgi:FkbM family methyltransferase